MLDYATMSFDTLMDKSERSMNGENGLQVTNEPIEVQNFRKIIDHLRGVYGIYLKLIQKNQKITTCNHLDLKSLGF